MEDAQRSVELDAPALEAEGARHLQAGDPARAAAALIAAADAVELPEGGLCVRIARALGRCGRWEEACAWAVRVVDAGDSYRDWTAAAGLLRRAPAAARPGHRRRLRLGLTATWTTSGFAPLVELAAAHLGLALELTESGFGQYFNDTLDPGSALMAAGPEALVLAPEHRALGVRPFSDTPEADAAAEIERWSAVWDGVRGAAAPIIVQHGFVTPGTDPLGNYAAGLAGSRASVVARIDAGLARRAAERDVGYVDAGALARRFGTQAWFDDRGWYMAKMPFAPAALPVLARHTAAVLAARMGYSRRVLVLDLDNTLWGGVIGDDGVAGITLGGGAEGEAFVDFQAAIKELAGRGIVLAVCSKNDPEVARRAFAEHPEAVLKLEDFAAFAASWGPKSEGIRAIARELSLGLDAFTFFDDNPYERAEVRRALPEVDVPVLPAEPTGFRRALELYPYFEPASFTDADRARGEQYRARARAEALRTDAGSLEDYQASLAMVARIGPVDALNTARVVQLINKTNQFNLTTRRRNQAELEAFLARDGVEHFWVRLADKFADHGLIAVALAEVQGDALAIDTLLMSCRVIGRGVEAMILSELAARAASRGCAALHGLYIPTERNGMVADLYPRLGLTELAREADGRVLWSADPAALVERSSRIRLERV